MLQVLQELVSESKLLKVSLEEPRMLERFLMKCKKWQSDACSLLQDADCLFETTDTRDEMHKSVIWKIENLVCRFESTRKYGLSLGVNFDELPKLQNACLKLQWCSKTLSLSSIAPSSEEVESLLATERQLSVTFASGRLWSLLAEGVKWLKRAVEVLSVPEVSRRCTLDDVREVLADSKDISISFKVMIGQLENAIGKHKLWQGQANKFFNLKPEDRSWSHLRHLYESGKVAGFKCSELDMVLSEVEKVERWKQCCMDSLGRFVNNILPLSACLQKVKQSVDRSLCVYQKSEGLERMSLCICRTPCSEDRLFLTCSMCMDRYHVECLGKTKGDRTEAEHMCFYCQFSSGGSIPLGSASPLKYEGKHPDITTLIELLQEAENFCIRIEELEMLQQILEQAAACNTCLRKIVDFALSYLDTDCRVVSKKLSIVLKAINIASVHDHKANSDLELALARNSWRIRVDKLLEGTPKPTIQEIQRHLKEAESLDVLPEDHFRQRLTELNCICLQWTERAKKVVKDSGPFGLESVFDLIAEGESLPLHLEKELKLLQERSMLHCICRNPYDARSMLACDQCGEWYHTSCIQLPSLPTAYICAACHPRTEELVSMPWVDHESQRSTITKFVEPKTPSPRHRKWVKRPKRTKTSRAQKMLAVAGTNSKFRNGISRLSWKNQKRIKRTARKRAQLGNFCPFFTPIAQQI